MFIQNVKHWQVRISQLQVISLLAMRGQSTPQLRDREWLNCVLLSPVILEELQEHSPYPPPHEMAQQVVSRWVHVTYSFRGIKFTTYILFNTVAGADYVAVAGEELVFNRGDTRVCHTIDILQDNICEYPPNENFFSDLAYVSGMQPITIAPPTAQVIIDDSDEPECEYSMSLPVGQRSCKKLRIAHE